MISAFEYETLGVMPGHDGPRIYARWIVVLLRGVLGLVGFAAQQVWLRHGDDVVAGIDEVDFAGDDAGQFGEQIEPGAAEVLQRHAAAERRRALLERKHIARVVDAGAGERTDRAR